MLNTTEHVRFKCSIMVNLFENLLSARAVIDSLSSIVSIDHFKTGIVSKFISKNFHFEKKFPKISSKIKKIPEFLKIIFSRILNFFNF